MHAKPDMQKVRDFIVLVALFLLFVFCLGMGWMGLLGG